MAEHTNNIIVGQGLAGTTLAWRLLDAGQSVVLIDRAESSTASKVAAGLVTPWTGRRMTQSEDYGANWEQAQSFYRLLEERLGQPLFEVRSMLRVFLSRSEEALYEERRAAHPEGGLQPWSGQLQPGATQLSGCRMQPAGRLNVGLYLQKSIDYFSEHGQWFGLDLQLPEALVVGPDQVEIPAIQLTADRVIFCQGAAPNPWFEGVPNNASRGDIINVRLPDYVPEEIVHHAIWLAPEADGSVTAGATYDWQNLHNQPTAKGRRELLKSIGRLIEGPVRVNRHIAGVRPAMKDYQPVIGRHAVHGPLWIFNGLGSRGVLTAPMLAQQLAAVITGQQSAVPDEVSPARLKPPRRARSLTEQAQQEIARVVQTGDCVVDATVGNGFDTAFLAEQVGSTGKVHGFDIQRQAIESTQNRLTAAGLKNVDLHHCNHADLDEELTVPVTAAMFNLGYLPRGDHSLVTQADSTIAALERLQDRLVDNGVITVMAYRGHAGGPEEATAVEAWLLAQECCTLQRIDSQPPKDSSPVLYVMRKTVSTDEGTVASPDSNE